LKNFAKFFATKLDLNYQYQASKMSVLKMPPNEDVTLNQDRLWST